MKHVRKIFAGLLAIHMLTLVFLPCNDICDSNHHTTHSLYITSQEHHQQENDLCSPFCSCSCCSTLITLVNSAEIKTFVKLVPNIFTPLKQSFISVYSGDCWQPPRSV